LADEAGTWEVVGRPRSLRCGKTCRIVIRVRFQQFGALLRRRQALGSLLSRQLEDRACQTTVGKSEFIQNREVVCVYDRNQATWEMSLSAVGMKIPTAGDHRRQLTRAISYGK